jgi:death-on-curing protein
MTEPAFLSIDDVLLFHHEQISRYGGLHGLRDMVLLQSAVAQPQATFEGQYLHQDIFEMAAAYLFHIVQNHPFMDGNKRVGLEAALVFLALNGYQSKAEVDALVNMVRSVARGKTGKRGVAAFFRKYTRRTPRRS